MKFRIENFLIMHKNNLLLLLLLFGIGVICLDGLDFKEDREK